MGILKKKFRNIKKFPDWIYYFPALLLKLLRLTMRVEIIDKKGVLYTENNVITIIWHNRLLFFPVISPKVQRRRTVAIVSRSRDGQYISDLLKCFEIRSARGSSSKGGVRALQTAINALNEGNHVALTPDGPRGPKYKLSKGPIYLATKSGASIYPCTVNSSNYWQLKSWDNFQIPKPFCKLTYILGEPINIPKNQDDSQIEEWRQKVEDALNDICVDKY